MTFVPPPSAELVSGDHGGKKARLTFWLGVHKRHCDYRGATGDPSSYEIEHCTAGIAAGSAVTADRVRWEVINGNKKAGPTVARIVLEEAAPCAGEGGAGGAGGVTTAAVTTAAVTTGPSCDGLDDANPCTLDLCDATGVHHIPQPGAPCPDETVCNGDETCDATGTVCEPGAPLEVDDTDPCTADACDPISGVSHTVTPGASCPDPDGDPCTGQGVCDALGACAGGPPPTADDGSACTIDLCEPGAGIKHLACSELTADVTTTMKDAWAFLYTGPDPIQTGVDAADIDVRAAAAIEGFVRRPDGSPAPLATVTVLGRPEYGETRTDAAGRYVLAVNGGGRLTIDVRAAGYLPAQRAVQTAWQRVARAGDVVLTALDPIATPVELSTLAEIAVAEGSLESDARGVRQGALMIMPGTEAELVFAGGTTQAAPSLTLRVTEYSVGPDGPRKMPALLPPTSGYTYAFEVSADEALAAGAESIALTEPASYFVESFIGVPVGTIVPVGSYDRTRGLWLPEENGLVLAIVDTAGGIAEIDTTGDGAPETDGALEALGIDLDTRVELAARYVPGAELMFMRLTHFSAFDPNFAFRPVAGGCGSPAECNPQGPQQPPYDPRDPSCEGSVLECRNQILREAAPVAGTPYSLHYSSGSAAGRVRPERRVTLPLTPAVVPAPLLGVHATVEVAGRFIEMSQTCPCAPSQTWEFTWDGLDLFGRPTKGAQPALYRLRYTYQSEYAGAVGVTVAEVATAFGRWGEEAIAAFSSPEYPLESVWPIFIGTDARAQGLGGLSLSHVHALDVHAGTLYFGDGTRRTVERNELVLREAAPSPNDISDLLVRADGSVVVATRGTLGNDYIYEDRRDGTRVTLLGDPVNCTVFGAVDVPAAGACTASRVSKIAEGPDGTLYLLLSPTANRVQRITPDGLLRSFAGTGSSGGGVPSGDGGPAAAAVIPSPGAIAAGPDGEVYIAHPVAGAGSRVRRVDPNGNIASVAGQSSAFGVPALPGPAGRVFFGAIEDLAVAKTGEVLVAHNVSGPGRIVRIDTSGQARTIAGNGTDATTDGILAINARFNGITEMSLWPDGTIDVVSSQGTGLPRSVVRRITTDGFVRNVAGRAHTTDLFGPVGGPAADARFGVIRGISAGPDGSFALGHRLRSLRVERELPGLGDELTQLIASEDGGELYVFDQRGRHLETRDALRNIVTLTIARDTEGRILSLTDQHGLTTTIERSANGDPVAIVGPFGHTTALTVNADGYLETIEDPTGAAFHITYEPGGLLKTWTNRNGHTTTVTWDTGGRLIAHDNAEGGVTLLTEVPNPGGHTVLRTTPLGRVSEYTRTEDNAEAITRTAILPSGLVTTTVDNRRGQGTISLPDGTVLTTEEEGDPRFAMQSPITASSIETLPSGLARTVLTARTAALADPDNLLSLTAWTETTTINGKTWTRAYDVASRTETVTSPEGRTTSTVYDAFGEIVEVQAPGDLPVTMTSDTFGRLTATTQGTRTTSRAYGADGLLLSVTDPIIQTTTFGRNARGDITSETRPDLETTLFDFDGEANTTSVTPPARPAHGMTYGPFELMTSYDPPPLVTGPTPTTYSYDLDKKLDFMVQPGPRLVDYAYDAAGRVDTITFPGGELERIFSPSTGQLVEILGPYGVDLGITYDGRLVTSLSWSGEITGSVEMQYDSDFRLSLETVNGAWPAAYGYDLDSLVTRIAAA
jgi:YD repeat-containing protein